MHLSTHIGRFGVPKPKTVPTSLPPPPPDIVFGCSSQNDMPRTSCGHAHVIAKAWPRLLHALVQARRAFWGGQGQDGAKKASGTTGGISVIFRGIRPGMVSGFVFGCSSQNGMPTVSWWQGHVAPRHVQALAATPQEGHHPPLI